MILNLCFIGPSGCGKTTQAELIAKKYQLNHFSVGRLFRQEIQSKSQLGQDLLPYVSDGLWAPDALAIKVVSQALSTCNYQNFIIDGFPRLLSQGRLLEEELLFKNHAQLTQIFHLNIPFSTIASRRLKQGLTTTENFSDQGRTDENQKGIIQRQKSYDETINPILNYYIEKNLLCQVDATPDIQTIYNNICLKIDQLLININQN